MTIVSNFQPIVTVADNGVITINWFNSYINTILPGGIEEYDHPYSEAHSNLIDQVLGLQEDVSDPDRLRALADYMEKHNG